jgi:hypothetical protein
MTRLASLLALGCLSGFGQYSGTRNTIAGVFRGEVHIGAQSRFTPITGAPYSGEIVTETVQTLADGTHIRHTMPPPRSIGIRSVGRAWKDLRSRGRPIRRPTLPSVRCSSKYWILSGRSNIR